MVAAVETTLHTAQSGEDKEHLSSKQQHNTLEDCLSKRQHQDPDLKDMIAYLETGELLCENKRAREILLSQSQFIVLDDVLHHIETDKTLRVVPPVVDQQKLLSEAHKGTFLGHLRAAKMHGQLSRHYWWPGMRKNITHWCQACLTCASRSVGSAVKPPLTPIPVGGPLDRIGVDILRYPKQNTETKLICNCIHGLSD